MTSGRASNFHAELASRYFLIIEDDELLQQRLARVMSAHSFKVITAGSVAESLTQVELTAPAFAVMELRLPDGCGLSIVEALKRRRPDVRIVI
jgi:two-component system, response regulator RegA